MPGRNLFGLSESLTKTASLERPCVFISYRSVDRPAAHAVAALCTGMNVDVWIDTRSADLLLAAETKDKLGVVAAIDRGLRSSTHLLGVLGPTTFQSPWVPYEIGGAHGRERETAHLVLGPVIQVPDYVTVSPLLVDEGSLRGWLSRLTLAGLKKAEPFLEGAVKAAAAPALGAHLPFARATRPKIIST